jgi:A1 cistron-splicing factor AAR2
VVVLRWDPSLEEFEYLNETKPDEAERYRLGVLRYDFDSTMGPYPISDTESRAAWLRLTNNITPDVLFRLEPIGKLMRARSKPLTPEEEQSIATASSIPHSDGPQATSSQQHDSVVKPGPGPRTPASSSSIYYTEIPKRFPSNEPIDPSALTKLNMDKTALLDLIVRRYFKNDIFMLLGEMQFSFLSFLLGQSFESFEQWKDIVQLLCSCGSLRGNRDHTTLRRMACCLFSPLLY